MPLNQTVDEAVTRPPLIQAPVAWRGAKSHGTWLAGVWLPLSCQGAGRIDLERQSGREGQVAGAEYKSSIPLCRQGSQGRSWEKETGPFPE